MTSSSSSTPNFVRTRAFMTSASVSTSVAMARPVLTRMLACLANTMASPTRSPRHPRNLEARRQVLEVGAGGGLDPPLRVLHPPDLELLLDLGPDGARVAVLEPQHARQERARLALEPRVAVGELEPRRRQRLHLSALGRADCALERARADVLAVAAGVAVDRPADGARDAGSVREPGEPAVAAELDEREVVGAAA